mmetsp:Transcript_30172/g.95197  ORF Transcript_30172/g.95197 Transcript_30172/m.95197 type:complete len:213 (+) Transcript_30172:22-660(+)
MVHNDPPSDDSLHVKLVLHHASLAHPLKHDLGVLLLNLVDTRHEGRRHPAGTRDHICQLPGQLRVATQPVPPCHLLEALAQLRYPAVRRVLGPLLERLLRHALRLLAATPQPRVSLLKLWRVQPGVDEERAGHLLEPRGEQRLHVCLRPAPLLECLVRLAPSPERLDILAVDPDRLIQILDGSPPELHLHERLPTVAVQHRPHHHDQTHVLH